MIEKRSKKSVDFLNVIRNKVYHDAKKMYFTQGIGLDNKELIPFCFISWSDDAMVNFDVFQAAAFVSAFLETYFCLKENLFQFMNVCKGPLRNIHLNLTLTKIKWWKRQQEQISDNWYNYVLSWMTRVLVVTQILNFPYDCLRRHRSKSDIPKPQLPQFFDQLAVPFKKKTFLNFWKKKIFPQFWAFSIRKQK